MTAIAQAQTGNWSYTATPRIVVASPRLLDDVLRETIHAPIAIDELTRPSGIIRRPRHLLPSRWQILDALWERWRFVPLPDMDIEYRSIFYRTTVPTSGKLYVNCHFIAVQYEIPNAPYAAIGCLDEGSQLYYFAQRYGYATLIGDVGIN